MLRYGDPVQVQSGKAVFQSCEGGAPQASAVGNPGPVGGPAGKYHAGIVRKPAKATGKDNTASRLTINSGCVSDGPIPAQRTSKSSIIIEENQNAQTQADNAR
jgi:hypothetical protein